MCIVSDAKRAAKVFCELNELQTVAHVADTVRTLSEHAGQPIMGLSYTLLLLREGEVAQQRAKELSSEFMEAYRPALSIYDLARPTVRYGLQD